MGEHDEVKEMDTDDTKKESKHAKDGQKQKPPDVEGDDAGPPATRPRGRSPIVVRPDPSSPCFTVCCLGRDGRSYYHHAECRLNLKALRKRSMEQALEAGAPAKTPRPHPAPDGVQMETVANISGGGMETLLAPVGRHPNLDLIP